MSTPIETSGSDFSATPSVLGDEITVALTGTGDMGAVAPLERCLTEVHELILSRELRAAKIDVSALYLLNSSCLKAFISLIHKNIASERRYAVRFVVDGRLAWQERTLGALRRLAPDLVSVTPRDPWRDSAPVAPRGG